MADFEEQAQATTQDPTLLGELKRRKAACVDQINKIDAAIALVESNPEVENLLVQISTALRY